MGETSGHVPARLADDLARPRIPSYLFASAAVSLLLTAVFYYSVVHGLCRETYAETILSERGPIPYMTTFFAFLALTQLLALRLHLRRESRNFELVAGLLRDVPEIALANAARLSARMDEQIGSSAR